MEEFCTHITIISLLLLGNPSHSTATVVQCTSTESELYTHCVIGYKESVCLVCPIYRTEPGLTWEYVNSSRHLFRDGSAVYENETAELRINECHTTNYSLKVSPDSTRYNKVFSCSQRKIMLTEFAVRREVPVKIFILQNQTEPLSALRTAEGRNITLQCVVVNGLPPILLKWTINGDEVYKQSFNSFNLSRLDNYTSSYSFVTTSKDHSVSCSAHGSYIKDQKVSIKVTVKRNALLPLSSQQVRFLLGTILVIMLTVMVTTLCFKKKRARRSKRKRVLPPQPPAEARRAVQSFFEDRGEDTDLNRYETQGVQTMNLLTSCGKMKRWTARLKGEPSSRVSCIVITLPEDSGAKDWCEFRMFVAYLKLIPKHKHIASILGMHTDKVPYQIIQEYVCNGSLKDFLIDQYGQIYTKSMQGRTMDRDPNSTNLTQVLKICISVIDAMTFLGKFDLVHPGICSRKVLMDDRMTCKLYDCHHRYIIEREMSQFVNKVTAPLAWLAPETLVEYKYHLKSDVWSAGVFLWEVMSLGKPPYGNTSLERLKLAVKTSPPLPEPGFSCEETYLLMKECWELDADKRPTLDLVLEDLQCVLNDVGVYETGPYEFMF